MQTLRVLQMISESTVSKTQTCHEMDCSRTTREGKDYCTIHVEKHPYVENLLDRIKKRKDEDELVRRKGSSVVNLDGITTKEILRCLKCSGERTEDRLSRETQIDKTIIHNYLIRLSNEGVIKFVKNSKNSLSVSLVKAEHLEVIEEED